MTNADPHPWLEVDRRWHLSALVQEGPCWRDCRHCRRRPATPDRPRPSFRPSGSPPPSGHDPGPFCPAPRRYRCWWAGRRGPGGPRPARCRPADPPASPSRPAVPPARWPLPWAAEGIRLWRATIYVSKTVRSVQINKNTNSHCWSDWIFLRNDKKRCSLPVHGQDELVGGSHVAWQMEEGDAHDVVLFCYVNQQSWALAPLFRATAPIVFDQLSYSKYQAQLGSHIARGQRLNSSR